MVTMKKAATVKKGKGKQKAKRLDLRTKAGRAWKAKEAEKARRAHNRAADKAAKAQAAKTRAWLDTREQARLDAAKDVSGSWVDLKDHPGNVSLPHHIAVNVPMSEAMDEAVGIPEHIRSVSAQQPYTALPLPRPPSAVGAYSKVGV